MESLSAEHTAIPAENPMEAPDDAAPMDENDIPDAEAIASPAENLPTASVPMLQAPGTTPPPPSSSAADEKTPMPKISKDQALTDTLKQDKTPGTAQNVIPLPKVEGTWVDKLATTNPLSILGDGKAKTSAAGTVQGRRRQFGKSGGKRPQAVCRKLPFQRLCFRHLRSNAPNVFETGG